MSSSSPFCHNFIRYQLLFSIKVQQAFQQSLAKSGLAMFCTGQGHGAFGQFSAARWPQCQRPHVPAEGSLAALLGMGHPQTLPLTQR